MVDTINYQRVKKWRESHKELHRERNKLYSNRRYHYTQQIKAFYNIDLTFFV